MKVMLVVAAVIAAALVASAPASAYYRHGSYYRSSDGSMVHTPIRTNHHLKGEMAVCRDGSHSMSHHHRGTCSHHGGVAHWG